MTDRVSKCVVILLTAVTLFAAAPPLMAQGAGGVPPAKGSVAKRVAWTIIGAAAGFGLGAWFGLHKFDDAINSDRKVWTSALLGAAAGGVAGGLLSRNQKPAPYVPPSRTPWNTQVDMGSGIGASAVVSWESKSDRALRTRIRTIGFENAER